jgi:uncharacterized protein (TIGR03067 family)
MKLPAVCLLMLVLSACSAEGTPKMEPDLAMLQGTWKPISMEMDGELLPSERIENTRLTIKGKEFTFDTGKDSHGGLYKIKPDEDPKQLDIEITRGDEKGKVYLVIYKFEDGKMIQCMEVSNAKRPSEFTGKAGSGNLYEVWERVK